MSDKPETPPEQPTFDAGEPPGTEGITPPLPPIPRKRGRPRGSKKTGGRQALNETWSPHKIRGELLLRSDAIQTLADVSAGKALLVAAPRTSNQQGHGNPAWRFPSMAERLKAAELVLRRCLPELSAQETVTKNITPDSRPPREQARAILDALREAASGDNEISALDKVGVSPSPALSDTAAVVVPAASGPVTGGPLAPPVAGPTSSGGYPSKVSPTEASNGSGPPPEIGERIVVDMRGTTIRLVDVDENGKTNWEIESSNGRSHGFVRGKDAAIARALALAAAGRV